MKANKSKKYSTFNQGFTLVEVLVVMAIVGMLASIALTSFSLVRKQARDTKRIADLKQMDTAIQAYIIDKGHAPYVGTYDCKANGPDEGSCRQVTEVQQNQWSQLESDLSTYLNELPTDPCGVKCFTPGGQGSYFAYRYAPPTVIFSVCNCSESEANQLYSIHAEQMEIDSPSYIFVYQGVPTFGYKNHSYFGSSF